MLCTVDRVSAVPSLRLESSSPGHCECDTVCALSCVEQRAQHSAAGGGAVRAQPSDRARAPPLLPPVSHASLRRGRCAVSAESAATPPPPPSPPLSPLAPVAAAADADGAPSQAATVGTHTQAQRARRAHSTHQTHNTQSRGTGRALHSATTGQRAATGSVESSSRTPTAHTSGTRRGTTHDRGRNHKCASFRPLLRASFVRSRVAKLSSRRLFLRAPLVPRPASVAPRPPRSSHSSRRPAVSRWA